MQAADFFQKAGQMAAKYGKIQWSQLKGLLQDKLVEQEVHRQTVAVRGKCLPLSVWEKKGFDTGRILKNAEKQRSDIFDWVYRVPILEISHEKVTEEVRQRMLQAERKVASYGGMIIQVPFLTEQWTSRSCFPERKIANC